MSSLARNAASSRGQSDQGSARALPLGAPRSRDVAQQELIADLTERLQGLAASELELRELLRETHRQLAERDGEIASLYAGRRPWEDELKQLYEERDGLRARLAAAEDRVSATLHFEEELKALYADRDAVRAQCDRAQHEIDALRSAREEGQELQALYRARLESAEQALASMRETRAWRAAVACWHVRDVFRAR